MRPFRSPFIVLALAAVAGLTAAPVLAADRSPGSFVWIISDTGFDGQGSDLAMARGKAWPVIFGRQDVVALQPTLGSRGTYWESVASGFVFGGGPIRAASAADGRVAGVSFGETGLVLSPTGTQSFLDSNIRSLTFNASGGLITADEFGVTGFPVPSGFGPITDVAVSPFGDGAAVNSDGTVYLTLTGEVQNLPGSFGGPHSVTFDTQGRPHMVTPEGIAYWFDTISAEWQSSSLGSNIDPRAIPLEADSTGTVGAAFVDNGDLIYAYWTATAGWQTTLVDIGVDFEQVGLDFDYQDLPVISYSKGGNLIVAYDPIAVPEPTSLLLLAGVGLAAMGRRQRRVVG